jgi:hypothetical protein
VHNIRSLWVSIYCSVMAEYFKQPPDGKLKPAPYATVGRSKAEPFTLGELNTSASARARVRGAIRDWYLKTMQIVHGVVVYNASTPDQLIGVYNTNRDGENKLPMSDESKGSIGYVSKGLTSTFDVPRLTITVSGQIAPATMLSPKGTKRTREGPKEVKETKKAVDIRLTHPADTSNPEGYCLACASAAQGGISGSIVLPNVTIGGDQRDVGIFNFGYIAETIYNAIFVKPSTTSSSSKPTVALARTIDDILGITVTGELKFDISWTV